MNSLDARTGFVRHTRWLALVLEALVLLSLLSGAIPFALMQPAWGLRLADAAVNLAPALLLAVILLRLGYFLVDRTSDDARINSKRSLQLASRWAFVFALLVPLQLVGFAWLWADSDRELNAQISRSETGAATLRTRLIASGSESELRRLLAESNPGLMPPLTAGSLAEQKQQLSEAISINVTRLHTTLRQQRSAMLTSTLPGSLRVFFGAAIVSAFLLMIRRDSSVKSTTIAPR